MSPPSTYRHPPPLPPPAHWVSDKVISGKGLKWGRKAPTVYLRSVFPTPTPTVILLQYHCSALPSSANCKTAKLQNCNTPAPRYSPAARRRVSRRVELLDINQLTQHSPNISVYPFHFDPPSVNSITSPPPRFT